jgi:hypothetical protein
MRRLKKEGPMAFFKKKPQTFLQRIVGAVTGAAKSVKANTSLAEELELQAAQKVFEISKERLDHAKKALKAKKSTLVKASK